MSDITDDEKHNSREQRDANPKQDEGKHYIFICLLTPQLQSQSVWTKLMVFALMIAGGKRLLVLTGCKDRATASVNKTNCCCEGKEEKGQGVMQLKSHDTSPDVPSVTLQHFYTATIQPHTHTHRVVYMH